MIKKLAALALMMLAGMQSVPLPAQVREEGRRFMEEAGGNATVFRSRHPDRYNFQYEGTYFWQEEELRPGGIMLDGKWFEGMLLNIDAYEQEVVAAPDGTRPAVLVRRDRVDWLTIGDDKYVNLNKKGYADVPAGFYRVEYEDGYTVYRRVEKRMA